MEATESATSPAEERRVYKLSLKLVSAQKGDDATFEREIPEELAYQVLAIVMGAGAAGPVGPQAPVVREPASAIRPSGQRQSVREYIDAVEAKRNVDKILAIASFLETVRGEETFSVDQIKREFRNARERVPGNYSRDFSWAVRNGWIAADDEAPGEYYVTRAGHEAVAAKFSDEVKKGTGVAKASRRRRARRTEVEG